MARRTVTVTDWAAAAPAGGPPAGPAAARLRDRVAGESDCGSLAAAAWQIRKYVAVTDGDPH